MTTKVIPKIISKQIVVEGKESELPNQGIFTNNNHSLKFDYDGDVGMPSRHHYSIQYNGSPPAVAGLITLFDTTNFGGTVETFSSKGITYDGTNGEFTISNNGIYKIELNAYLQSDTSGAIPTFEIRVNGTAIWAANSSTLYVNSAQDPVEASISLIKSLNSNDVITVVYDAVSTGTGRPRAATTLNIYRFA